MQQRRISFWIYWAAVGALTLSIASGVSADAKISHKAPAVAATAEASGNASAVKPAEPAAAPVAGKAVPLAEAMPKPANPDVQVGIASWYGGWHQGRLTASGERFDEHKLTAAHRSLPLDTRVKVTNLENGRSVEVKVNDRGPYVPGRVLDLSARAAQVLGMKKEGLALVRIEREPEQTASADLD